MSEIKLVKRIKYAGDVHSAMMKLGWYAKTAAAFLDSIPDADAVVVVRCKDCIFREEPHIYGISIIGELRCRVLGVPMNLDDFCSYGERRADDADRTET